MYDPILLMVLMSTEKVGGDGEVPPLSLLPWCGDVRPDEEDDDMAALTMSSATVNPPQATKKVLSR
jgi:hypothetical protein